MTQVINVSVGDIHKVVKIRQCRAAEEKVIPRKVDYEADEPRQKRLLGGIISGGINALFRVSIEGRGGGGRWCRESASHLFSLRTHVKKNCQRSAKNRGFSPCALVSSHRES